MNKKFMEELFGEIKISNLGEIKTEDVLVFQVDFKKADAFVLGKFMEMIKEEGYRAVVFPQIDKIVDKYDIENALHLNRMAKLQLEQMKQDFID